MITHNPILTFENQAEPVRRRQLQRMNSVVIIEDEKDSQVLLKKILEQYCSGTQILGVAANISEGRELLSLNPDIVFLDVQLGTDCGFELLQSLRQRSFKLIVTTAFKEYALKAFEYEAIAYVMKPYSPKAIVEAVDRTKKILHDRHIYDRLSSLINSQVRVTRISVPTAKGYEIIELNSIINIEADRSYCSIYLDNEETLVVSRSLKEMQEMLPASQFYRSHTSHLINLKGLERYSKEDGGYAIMTNGKSIPISRRKKIEFIELLKSGLLGYE